MPDEFLRWNEGREGKREFVDGKVVEMTITGTERHYRLASRLLVQLATQLDPETYIVGSADFGVRTVSGVRFPDVMVHKPLDANSLATASPLLIAEVLSPSSLAEDFGPKASDYLSIRSLQHHLILAQNDTALWLWTRRSGGFKGLVLHRDPIPQITLAAMGLALNLSTLYSGIASVTPNG